MLSRRTMRDDETYPRRTFTYLTALEARNPQTDCSKHTVQFSFSVVFDSSWLSTGSTLAYRLTVAPDLRRCHNVLQEYYLGSVKDASGSRTG